MENRQPTWLSTWQAICNQETEAKMRYKKFMDNVYRTETKMKLMDLRVDAMLKNRDAYLAHLFQKYPNWKPNFTSYGLKSSSQGPTDQPELFQMVETEIMRSLRQEDESGLQGQPQQVPNFGPLLPSSYHSSSHRPIHPSYNLRYPSTDHSSYFPAPSYYSGPFHMGQHEFGIPAQDATVVQMNEMKNEMSQIKSRLEDITVYLRELKHSAIELTTSVSRRSSMRDKERRGIRVNDASVEYAHKQPAVERKEMVVRDVEEEAQGDHFAEKVKEKLIKEKTTRQRKVRYDEELSEDSEESYQAVRKHTASKENPQSVKAHAVSKEKSQSTKRQEEHPKPVIPVVDDDQSDRSVEIPSKGPRFDFSSSGKEEAQKKAEAKPQSRKDEAKPHEPIIQKQELSADDETSVASDSPPVTATWLMGRGQEVSKSSAAPPAPVQPRQTKPVEKEESDTSGASTPVPKVTAESSYLALLGSAAKPQLSAQKTPESKKADSDSDDLDEALGRNLSPPRQQGAITKKTTETRDASLSDIFSFGKPTTTNKQPSSQSTSAPLTSTAKQDPATKKGTAIAEPDDFLKKLFPDKFSSAAAKTKESAPGKKSTGFFTGDDSEDDIHLPQGKTVDDGLDDFFFK